MKTEPVVILTIFDKISHIFTIFRLLFGMIWACTAAFSKLGPLCMLLAPFVYSTCSPAHKRRLWTPQGHHIVKGANKSWPLWFWTFFSDFCTYFVFLEGFRYFSKISQRRQIPAVSHRVPQSMRNVSNRFTVPLVPILGFKTSQKRKGAYDICLEWVFWQNHWNDVKNHVFFMMILTSIGAFSCLGWFSMHLAPFLAPIYLRDCFRRL